MKRWILAPADDVQTEALAKSLELSRPAARALVSRGYSDPEKARAFLNPSLAGVEDPLRIPGMSDAVSRIVRALQNRERIAVFGDYDADGVTATALLMRVLRPLGGDAVAFLPHRVDDGYGLSVEATLRCIEQHSPRLIVTVDCGTSAVEAVQLAAEKGVDVVVTDHHLPGKELAPASAIVNPKLGGSEAVRDLAGVGVAFKLCYALARQTRGLTPQALRRHLDLVAIGTIADVVPLRSENRILARHGLTILADSPCVGLKALKQQAGVAGFMEAWHVGYVLGPRLNAAGRLDSAQQALDLLLSDDVSECQRIAESLGKANADRQRIEKDVFEQVLAEWEQRFDPTSDYAIVADGVGWHRGVIGIVASRICRHFYRPAIVLARPEDPNESARGSCRSIEEFNIVEHLGRCSDLLERFGGHAMAAGLDVRVDRIVEFRKRFNEVAKETLLGKDLRPIVRIDAAIEPAEVGEKLINDAQQFEPCGTGNPKPVWAFLGVKPVQPPQVLKDAHIVMMLGAGPLSARVIGFNMADRPIPDGALDLAFEARWNLFRGTPEPELRLVDFRAQSNL